MSVTPPVFDFVVIGAETQRLEIRPGESLQLKGFQQPVQSYTLAAA